MCPQRQTAGARLCCQMHQLANGHIAAPVDCQGLCGPSAVPASACCTATANMPLHRRSQADVARILVWLPHLNDQGSCENYRPVSVLAAGYTFYASFLLCKLLGAGAEDRMWTTQMGFQATGVLGMQFLLHNL